MVTVAQALELLGAGFSVDDIRAMDTPTEQEPKQEPKQEPEADPRIDALTATVEKLVDVVGKMPFYASMGTPNTDADADAILASIINPPKKGDK